MPNFSKTRWRSLVISFVVALSLLAVACGGDSGTSSSQSQSTSDPTASPSSTATASGSTGTTADATATPPAVAKFELDSDSGQAPFAPVITNLSENSDSFTWDFGDGSDSSSTESPSHSYTKSGSFVLELTVDEGGGSAKFTQTITVEPGPLAGLQITPSEVSVPANETFKFSADGVDEFGNAVEDVDLAWSASEEAGSIDSAGLFTATTMAGNYSKSVTVSSDGGAQQASIDVVVDPGPPTEISLEPTVISLEIGGSQELTLKVSDEFGNDISDPLASWKVESAIGSIDDNDVFTAGTKSGVYNEGITVDVVSGSTALSATAVLGVDPDPLASITVIPSIPIVRKNETLKLEATGADKYGNTIPKVAFLWDSAGLNVDSTGKVIAGEQEGLFQVTVQASYKGSQESVTLNIGVPPVLMPLEDMSSRRISHTATLLNDGTVLILGGNRSSGTPEIFDPSTNKFTPIAKGLGTRHGHTATLLQDGTVLLVSGACADRTAEIYDPSTGIYSNTTGDLSQGRRDHSATLLNSGKVLISGGACETSDWSRIGQAEVYDPDTGTFSQTVGEMIFPRSEHAAELLSTGDVLIARGRDSSGCTDIIEVYDSATDSFRKIGTTIFSSSCADDMESLAMLPDGRWLITQDRSTEIYDPVTESLAAGVAISTRYRQTVTALQDGTILISGGHTGNTGMNDTALIYDPVSNTIATTIDMPAARMTSTATLLPSGSVLITGGNYRVNGDPKLLSNLATAEIFVP